MYDLVVWGATGFTGRLVADYLYKNYSAGQLRWAIAGRSQAKLNEIQKLIGDESGDIPTLIADSADESSLRQLAKQTKVVLSTVGPYAHYGSLLVKVCSETGTDYCDLTGEVPWIRRMIDAHREAAELSGARIVHSCGFDSVPSDMGVYFLQQQASKQFQAPLKDVAFYLKRMKGGASGGTIHSMINVLKEASADSSVKRLMFNPYSLNPDTDFRGPDLPDQMSIRYDEGIERWTSPFVMAGINTRIVRRSNAVSGFGYGENFSYREVQLVGKGLRHRIGARVSGLVMGLLFLMLALPPTRWVLESFVLPKQGQGPKVDPNNPGFYEILLRGTNESDGEMQALVKGDADPGYGSTSKMLAEAAISLAKDTPITEGGFWTPSTALGDAYLQRLQDSAGLSFELLGEPLAVPESEPDTTEEPNTETTNEGTPKADS